MQVSEYSLMDVSVNRFSSRVDVLSLNYVAAILPYM